MRLDASLTLARTPGKRPPGMLSPVRNCQPNGDLAVQPISQDFDQTGAAMTGTRNNLVTAISLAVFGFLARRRTRHVIQNLSTEQLRDAGIDRADVFGNRPVIEVDRDPTRFLASLR